MEQKSFNNYNNKRIVVFRFLSVIIALLFLLLIEVILRISGYGYNTKLFVESKYNRNYLEMNQDVAKKFFSDTADATFGNVELFKKEKTADTYRVFVLGESTTIGFPYRHNGSFHRWLKYRLMFTFPEKEFEIINISLTAVNSYTLANFAKEIVNYQPDAVLIYVGHNEYYGALGVGSTTYLGNNPKIIKFIIKMRGLRLFQLMSNSINGLKQSLSDNSDLSKQGLMAKMPADKKIYLGSKKYLMGLKQFEYNMNEVCHILSAKNIPVLFSNVVSNEKDLKPFISDDTDVETSANQFYKKAGEKYQKGNFADAKNLFVQAKEYDLLRFRAPKEINKIISSLCDKYPNVDLVDSKWYFEKYSPKGILGNETLLEHVHPNLFGYAILSEAFYNRMQYLKLISNVWPNEMPFNDLLKNMPVTVIDSIRGAIDIEMLKNSWPFTNSPVNLKYKNNPADTISSIAMNLVFEKIDWNDAIGQLAEVYTKSKNLAGALKVSEALSLEYPQIEKYYRSSAHFAYTLRDFKKAAFYYGKVFKYQPDTATAKLLLSLNIELDKPDQALQYIEYMYANSGNNYLKPAIQLIKEMALIKKQLSSDPENIEYLSKMAINYMKIRHFSHAKKYAGKVLQYDSQNADALKIKADLMRLPQSIRP